MDEAIARSAQADVAGALRAWADALEIGPSHSHEAWARDVLLRAQGRVLFDAPPSPPPPAPASPAWERLWAGDVEAARRLVEPGPDGVGKLGVLGVAHVLDRRPHAAIPLLDRALTLGAGEDIALFRVRALLQLGRLDEARRALAGLIDGETMARRLLVASLHVRRAAEGRRLIARAKSQPHFLNGLFSTQLPAVVGAGALDRALASRASLTRLLDDVLDRMAGNLGPSPTLAETAPDGSRRFVRVEVPRGARAEAVRALDTLRFEGPAAAEAAFAAVVAQNPRSTHAHCYLGELYLWLGRYDDAWREFVAARRASPREPPRWADIGMVAVMTFTGRYRRARVLALYARYHFTPAAGGTLPVYRGALRRRTGDVRGAIEDLRSALADKPSRLGARIEPLPGAPRGGAPLRCGRAPRRDHAGRRAAARRRRRDAGDRLAARAGAPLLRRRARRGPACDAGQPLLVDGDVVRPDGVDAPPVPDARARGSRAAGALAPGPAGAAAASHPRLRRSQREAELPEPEGRHLEEEPAVGEAADLRVPVHPGPVPHRDVDDFMFRRAAPKSRSKSPKGSKSPK